MSRRSLVFAIFVLSGAAGLVYEVVWGRQLVLVFGNTTQAVSAILTGFFGGMAIGSALGGRIADRVRRPLRMYGLLELALVVLVLLTPVTFRLLHEVYRGVFDSLVTAPTLLALVRFGLALLALGPATIFMGATLPTLTRYLTREASGLSLAFGRLYFANTFGAILGTLASGFMLIELLGLSGTLLVGAGCSAIAGGAALLLDWTASNAETARAPAAVAEAHARAPDAVIASAKAAGNDTRPRVRLALAVAYVSGLTSLGYQVLWTRLLASGTGNSTYVFATILAIFLTGIAFGAAAFNYYRERIHTLSLLAVCQIVIAALVLLGMATITYEVDPGNLVIMSLMILPATFVMGLTFPATSALVADKDGHVGSNAGLLLSANTLGAITGTFLVPFVVIPLVGSAVAVGLVALLNAATGVVLALAGRIELPQMRRLTATGGAVAAAVLVVTLATGTMFIDPNIAWMRAHHYPLARAAEDEIASVQAGYANGYPMLWVTGTAMTTITVDTKLMPILPLILRPHATTDLTIAFGMGTAYRAAVNAGLNVDAVELVPSVPQMFGVYYPDAQQVTANPRSHVIIADGRNYVELTNHHYDIIVVDPPPPIYSSGVSVISSHEFYQAAKARLNPGGVMMQWIPFGESVEDLKAHLRTFRDVFAHVIVAFGPGGAGLYMLGSQQPITFDPAAMRAVLSRPGVLEDLSSAPNSPQLDMASWMSVIPGLVWLQGDQVAAFAGKGPLVTDDHPLPEYYLLRQHFGPQSPPASRHLLESLTPPTPSASAGR